MNRKFESWVTGTAFNLLLSKPQIKAILALSQQSVIGDELIDPMTIFALERRGLLSRESAKLCLTKAGELVAGLIAEAGFTAEQFDATTARDLARNENHRVEAALQLAHEGLDAPEIARRLGIHRVTAWRRLKRAGVERPRSRQ